MSRAKSTVLVVGATGSIGRLVVAEALRQGHAVRALVRDAARARGLPAVAERVAGDLTQPQTLTAAVAGIDAVVFTHGSDGGGKAAAEQVDYGGVRNVLLALDGRPVRIALMTAIGVTNRAPTTVPRRAMTGSAAASAWCAPAACPTPSCVRAGSTFRRATSSAWSCCRATGAARASRATASSRGARSPRCWCAA